MDPSTQSYEVVRRLMLLLNKQALPRPPLASEFHHTSMQAQAKTFCYCTCNLLAPDPSSHLPEPGSLCLTPGRFTTGRIVWISWLTRTRPAFDMAKHPSMLKLHSSLFTLAFDHAHFVSQTVPMVYLTCPSDRVAPSTAILYCDLTPWLKDL